MCGIAGCVDLGGIHSADELREIARRMAGTLSHRGPDDRDAWSDAGVGLGHQRLSVLDLSPSGRQPMHSACGRFTIVYNGEIYNHRELHKELAAAGRSFRGTCDTEVLIEAIAQWGLEATLKRLNGMFAFALFDHAGRTLTLVRDRIGVKPLYYGWSDDEFLFGSELKALRRHPRFQPTVSRGSVALLLEHSYIPAPWSIYEGIYKLSPGTRLTIDLRSPLREATPIPFWSMNEVAARGHAAPFRGTPAEAVDELDRLLRDAVEIRSHADVPLGAFLSGGIDSSTVVAIMQAQHRAPVKAFTIGFEIDEYNEAEYARAVADHLHVEHVTQYVTPQDALSVIERLPTLYDEPFADSSQIPTFLVSQLAREHVTVALSGDGGDELFGGYNRYAHAQRAWKKIGWLPLPLRRLAAGLLQRARPLRGKPAREAGFISSALRNRDFRSFYAFLHRHWRGAADVVIDAAPLATAFSAPESWPDRGNKLEAMTYVDSITYLPECILTKLDRASMGVSLEARVPLLDHRLVEFAWTLPASMKVVGETTKWPLRELLARYVPRKLFERPKIGFGVPIGAWLRSEIRDWAEDLLAEERLRREGFFRPEPIHEKWQEHVSGRADWSYLLWDVLMFQAWLTSV